jgi:hypothetical protein
MESTNLQKPSSCPQCGGTDIKQIMYGLPMEETMKRAKLGEVVLGGCCVFEGMPDWHCPSCRHEWFDSNDPARIEQDRLIDEIRRKAEEQRSQRAP